MLDLSKFSNPINASVGTPTAQAPEAEVYKAIAGAGDVVHNTFLNLYDRSLKVERAATVASSVDKAKMEMTKEYSDTLNKVGSNGNIHETNADGVLEDTGVSFDDHINKKADQITNSIIEKLPDSATKRQFHQAYDGDSFNFKTKAFLDKTKKVSDFATENFNTSVEVGTTAILGSAPHSLIPNYMEGLKKLNVDSAALGEKNGILAMDTAKRNAVTAYSASAATALVRNANLIPDDAGPASAFLNLKFKFKDFGKFSAYYLEQNPDLKDNEETRATLESIWNQPVDGSSARDYDLIKSNLKPEVYNKTVNDILNIKFKHAIDGKANLGNDFKQLRGYWEDTRNSNENKLTALSQFNSKAMLNNMPIEERADKIYEITGAKHAAKAAKDGISVSYHGFDARLKVAQKESLDNVKAILGEEGLKAMGDTLYRGAYGVNKLREEFMKAQRANSIIVNRNPVEAMISQNINNTQDSTLALNNFIKDGKGDSTLARNHADNINRSADEVMARYGAFNKKGGYAQSTMNIIAKSVNDGDLAGAVANLRVLGPHYASGALQQAVLNGDITGEAALVATSETLGNNEENSKRVSDILYEATSKNTSKTFWDKDTLSVNKDEKAINEDIAKMNKLTNTVAMSKLSKIFMESGLDRIGKLMGFHKKSMDALAFQFYRESGDPEQSVQRAEELYFNKRIKVVDESNLQLVTTPDRGNNEIQNANSYARDYLDSVIENVKSGNIIPSEKTLTQREQGLLHSQHPKGENDPLYHTALRDMFVKYLEGAKFVADSSDGSASKLHLRKNLGTGNFTNIIVKNKQGKPEALSIDLIWAQHIGTDRKNKTEQYTKDLLDNIKKSTYYNSTRDHVNFKNNKPLIEGVPKLKQTPL